MRARALIAGCAAAAAVMFGSAGVAGADPVSSDSGDVVVVDGVVDTIEPAPPRGGVQARSADGCTLSNTGGASLNCVYVNGTGTYVNYMRARMELGGAGLEVGDNVCNRGYEFQYYRQGFTAPRTFVYNQTGCAANLPGLAYSFTHQVNANLANGTTACTRTRSNLSDNEWSPYACVYILA